MQLHQFQISELFPIEFTPDVKRALLLLHGWTIFCKARDGANRFDYYCACPCDGSEFDSPKKAQAHFGWSWKILLDDIEFFSNHATCQKACLKGDLKAIYFIASIQSIEEMHVEMA